MRRYRDILRESRGIRVVLEGMRRIRNVLGVTRWIKVGPRR